ncbi:hypothetical protein [Streptomyces apricus]|nr:hypothetical protein [Streptomyces apricus]
MTADRCTCEGDWCSCGYIPPGSLPEQSMAMIADDEPEVFDGDW